jgi:aldose 1-epimerase
VLPSGRQHEIRYADQRAVITEVGATLRAYEVAGFAVLDGFSPDAMASAGRGQPLIPWPNRVADGRYEFDGRTHELALTEPRLHNAIHGLVRWSSWELLGATAARVRLGHHLWPQPGYPFHLALELEYELGPDGLRVTIGAENAGSERAPYGAGQHPYLRAQLGTIDGSSLRLPAILRLETDDRQIPTGRRLDVTGTEFDFIEPRPIGPLRFDTAFAGLRRDADGKARAVICAPAGGRRVTMWMDAGFDYLMVFSGDPLSGAERRQSLALEPMTCAPDAFRNGRGLLVLAPGERAAASWGVSVGFE